MDWTTIFPYTILASILLFGIGIYALITCKKFLRAIFSIEILLMAANILLISFGFGFTGETLTPDPTAQVFSIFIIIIGIILFLVGIAIERKLRQSGDSTILEFNFKVEGLENLLQSENDETVQNEQQQKGATEQ